MSDAVHISPNYRASEVDLTKLDDRIKVYEDQIKGWFFGPAKALLSMPHSAFAVLNILMGYFENHAIYRSGKSSKWKSKKFFREGFTAVFPRAAEGDLPGVNLEEVSKWLADAMYDDATLHARDRLAAITGPGPASFVYDGTGRRRAKTIDG